MQIDDLIHKYASDFENYANLYTKHSNYYNNYSKYSHFVSLVIKGVLIIVASFSSRYNLESFAVAVIIINVVLSTINAVQLNFQWDKLAEQFKTLARECDKERRSILYELTLEETKRQPSDQYLSKLKVFMDELIERSPTGLA